VSRWPRTVRAATFILLFGCFGQAIAQDAARDALIHCFAQFDDEADRETLGWPQIEKRCPELESALENSPYAAWLPEAWQEAELTTASLQDLHDQIAWESAERPPRTLDTAGVALALESLGDESAADPVTWWDRVREWLRARLQPAREEEPSWLFKWMDELGKHQTALRIIGYCLFGIIVAAAGIIVFNELRAAGVFGPRWHLRGGSRDSGAPGRGRGPTLADLAGSDPTQRPALLIALVVSAFARNRGTVVDASATHRELTRRIELDNDTQRSAFARLIECAERVRYAATLPAAGDIDTAVSEGRRLLATLSAEPGSAAA
jgi:hypothetical protein